MIKKEEEEEEEEEWIWEEEEADTTQVFKMTKEEVEAFKKTLLASRNRFRTDMMPFAASPDEPRATPQTTQDQPALPRSYLGDV